jgi:hypothetical protein
MGFNNPMNCSSEKTPIDMNGYHLRAQAVGSTRNLLLATLHKRQLAGEIGQAASRTRSTRLWCIDLFSMFWKWACWIAISLIRAMPFKHNAARHHRIGKMKFKVTNWREYEAGLRQRGSLTLWVMPETLAGWHAPRRRIRGGQRRYSDLAIETALTLACVFGLRQTEGFIRSILDLLGQQLPVPDHTTLSRRAQIASSGSTIPAVFDHRYLSPVEFERRAVLA